MVPTPADKPGHLKGDIRFSERTRSACATTWCAGRRTTKAAASTCLAQGSIGTTTWIRCRRHLRHRRLAAVAERGAGPVFAVRQPARGEVQLRVDSAGCLRDLARVRLRTWDDVARDDLRRGEHLVALDGQPPVKTGASFTYDVTEQLYQPLQNGVYLFDRRPAWRPRRSSSSSPFALVPEAQLMFPKAYADRRLHAGRLADHRNLTLNLGLRYDVEIIKDNPDWPAPTTRTTSIRDRVRVGPEGRSEMVDSRAASGPSPSNTRSSPSSKAAWAAATGK